MLEGAPTLRTPEGERVLAPGDVVCFALGEEGAHSLRGPGRVLMLSAGRLPEVAVYPDSGKVGPRAHGLARLNFRIADAVDYWEGE